MLVIGARRHGQTQAEGRGRDIYIEATPRCGGVYLEMFPLL